MEFFRGIRYAISGFGLIFKKGIKRFVFIPVLINIIVFSIVIFFSAQWISDISQQMTGWWQWLEWLLWPLFILISLVVIFFTFAIVANMLAAPFNGFLAEAVERHLTGDRVLSVNQHTWRQEFAKVLAAEYQKLRYFSLRGIPLMILALIPGLQLIWLIFAAWMLALEYLDYPMGNHGYFFAEEREIIKKQRFLALGFGATVMFITIIPLVNFIAMPVAVAGASHLWLKEIKPSLEA